MPIEVPQIRRLFLIKLDGARIFIVELLRPADELLALSEEVLFGDVLKVEVQAPLELGRLTDCRPALDCAAAGDHVVAKGPLDFVTTLNRCKFLGQCSPLVQDLAAPPGEELLVALPALLVAAKVTAVLGEDVGRRARELKLRGRLGPVSLDPLEESEAPLAAPLHLSLRHVARAAPGEPLVPV